LVAAIWKFVKEFVGPCDVFACARNPRHCFHKLLQPLLVPTSPWSSICMDFIMDFPWSNSFVSILVVVNRFTKMVHFIPCNKSIIVKKTTKLFLDHVFCYHGLLENNIFYRGPQFAYKFWNWLFKLLNVKVKLSSTFHP
jgi:hypothetical protein